MATEVTTVCTCDWCGAVIATRDGDASNTQIAHAHVTLKHLAPLQGWYAEDLCQGCIRDLNDLRALRKQAGAETKGKR